MDSNDDTSKIVLLEIETGFLSGAGGQCLHHTIEAVERSTRGWYTVFSALVPGP